MDTIIFVLSIIHLSNTDPTAICVSGSAQVAYSGSPLYSEIKKNYGVKIKPFGVYYYDPDRNNNNNISDLPY